MRIHDISECSSEKRLSQDDKRAEITKQREPSKPRDISRTRDFQKNEQLYYNYYNNLESKTKDILESLAKEYSSTNHYNTPYYIRGKSDKIFQSFIKESLLEADSLDEKAKVYLAILKETLDTATNFHYSVKPMYQFSNDNFIATIIEEGLNLTLKSADLDCFFSKVENSNIDRDLVKKVRIGLQFIREFNEGDLLYGSYGKNCGYNGGITPYHGALYQFSKLKEPNTVVEISKKINLCKENNEEMSPFMQDIDNYFTHHPNPKFQSLDEQNDWKRRSKGMLQYCFDKPIKVHFILDELNMGYVVSKRKNSQGLHLISSSELRFIYRQWLKNPQLVERKIDFWLDGVKVLPPWKRNPDLWALYKTK